MRPPVAPPAGLPAVPTVVEPVGGPPPLDVDPEELAAPAELVPGVLTDLAAVPAPLGSLLELLRPPTLGGGGAPTAELAPADPTPCAPAGDEAAPAAAPLDDAPPADPPPAPPAPPPRPPPPPPPCARADIGDSRTATRSNLLNEQGIGKLLSTPTPWQTACSKK
jgi:hypothetical protein